MTMWVDGADLGWVLLAAMSLGLGLGFLAGRVLVRRSSDPVTPRPAGPSPRAVLDRRLAAGEVDAEQYAQLRRLLEDRAAPPAVPDGGTRRR